MTRKTMGALAAAGALLAGPAAGRVSSAVASC
jgi:hypothetical protein